ncbi:MAG: adenosine deaminase, partial [Planctomycetia bacterium]
SYICDSLDLLGTERIDHGVRCLEDHQLVERLIRQQIPLTVCPLSNKALKVFPDLSKHPIRKMLNLGLLASIHSDDPAYFGGYIGENYSQCEDLIQLTREELALSARNSIRGSFLGKEEKSRLLEKLRRYCESQQVRLP